MARNRHRLEQQALELVQAQVPQRGLELVQAQVPQRGQELVQPPETVQLALPPETVQLVPALRQRYSTGLPPRHPCG